MWERPTLRRGGGGGDGDGAGDAASLSSPLLSLRSLSLSLSVCVCLSLCVCERLVSWEVRELESLRVRFSWGRIGTRWERGIAGLSPNLGLASSPPRCSLDPTNVVRSSRGSVRSRSMSSLWLFLFFFG
jgi:hypothetical protein